MTIIMVLIINDVYRHLLEMKDIISILWSFGTKWLKNMCIDSYHVFHDDWQKKCRQKNEGKSCFCPHFIPTTMTKPEINSISSPLIWNAKRTNKVDFGFGFLWRQKMGTKLLIWWMFCSRKGIFWVSSDVYCKYA